MITDEKPADAGFSLLFLVVQISSDEKSHFYHQSVVEGSQIKAGFFLDLVETIDQCISVNIQFTGGL